MPASSAVPPTAGDRSLIASDSEEYEYEEIEVEEEEEVTVGDGDNEEEEEGSGEDLSPSIEHRDGEKTCNRLQKFGSMKACRHDKSIILAVKTTVISNDEKSPQCDGGIMTAEIANPINKSIKLTTSDKVPHLEEQTTQVNTKDVNDAQQKESRLDVDVPLIRPRRLSPTVEIKEGSKRPTLVCKAFAKGWCILGTSCRFRHIKDTTNLGDKQNETQKSDQGDICPSEIKSSFNDVDKNNPPVNADNLLRGPLSNPFMGCPNIHGSNWVSSYASKGYHFGPYNHNYNSSLVWPRASTLLSSASWKSDSKFSSYDWEPSKPFRSAFLLSQGISTPDIQYDPIRDSIEPPPKIGDKLSKLPTSSQVPSISGTHLPFKEILRAEYSSDRFSFGMDMDGNEAADTKQEITESESKGKKHSGDVIQASEVHVGSHSSLRQNDGEPTKEVNKQKLESDAEGDKHTESNIFVLLWLNL